MHRFFWGLGLFFVTAIVGTLMSRISWDGAKYSVAVTEPADPVSARDPAAIRKNFDFSQLEGGALYNASKQRLLTGSKMVFSKEEIGIGLGHFVVSDRTGKKSFACTQYDKIQLTFEADGFAVNGERPHLEIMGDCVISQDINEIEPMWVPVAKILSEKPADGELAYHEGHKVNLKFVNVIDVWPKKWVLQSARIFSSNDRNQEFRVEPKEVRDILGSPMIMDWDNFATTKQ
jgi:hypothetical protein